MCSHSPPSSSKPKELQGEIQTNHDSKVVWIVNTFFKTLKFFLAFHLLCLQTTISCTTFEQKNPICYYHSHLKTDLW